MTTENLVAEKTVILQKIKTVTIPFEFELEVSGGFEDLDKSDPAQLAMLAGVWSEWWSHFALDLAAPEDDAIPSSFLHRKRVLGTATKVLPRDGAAAEAKLYNLGLVHPSELGGLGDGKEYRHAPFSRRNDRIIGHFLDPTLAQLYPLLRRPSPNGDFAFTLAARPKEKYKGDVQLFCVGIPMEDWNRPLPENTHPFDLVVFEIGFCGFTASVGTLNFSGGSGFINLQEGCLILGLLIALTSSPISIPMQEYVHRIEIESQYQSLLNGGSACAVNGYINFDLHDLTSKTEAKLRGNAREDICMFQAALHMAGYPPGPIDGLYNKYTIAAEQNFRTNWNLEGCDRTTPIFSETLIKALRGVPH